MYHESHRSARTDVILDRLNMCHVFFFIVGWFDPIALRHHGRR